MSFLNQNNAEFLSARLTQKGRKSIAEGDFQIKFFQKVHSHDLIVSFVDSQSELHFHLCMT